MNCFKRHGHCLQQVITTKPIPWGIVVNPYTYLGDPNWDDYEISADAMLDGRGKIALLGRIDSADVFHEQSARWPSAYTLTVNEKGEWQLNSTRYKITAKSLAHGTVPFPTKTWHRLALSFQATNIEASIDNVKSPNFRSPDMPNYKTARNCASNSNC